MRSIEEFSEPEEQDSDKGPDSLSQAQEVIRQYLEGELDDLPRGKSGGGGGGKSHEKARKEHRKRIQRARYVGGKRPNDLLGGIDADDFEDYDWPHKPRK